MADKTPEWMRQGDGFVDVTLSRAMMVDGADVEAVRMREPTVNDQLVAAETKGGEAKKEVAFFANLCDMAPADLGRLPIRDYARLQTAFSSFID